MKHPNQSSFVVGSVQEGYTFHADIVMMRLLGNLFLA